jgi:transcription elongation GreA/GreB family factor
MISKQALVTEIQRSLALELEEILKAANSARQAATHEESRAEDSHDTRATEASYLADAQAKRASEIQRLILIYKFLPVRDYSGKDEVISPGALAELEYNGTQAYYFVAPEGGGLIMRMDGKAVQVITPNSPMGESIMGRRVGETIEVETRSGTREYKVLSLA